MSCECRSTELGFRNWTPFQEAAWDGGQLFGTIPRKPGVYCLRALRIGENDQSAAIAKYLKSPLFAALRAMGNASEKLFNDCGFGEGWGWKWYAKEARDRLDSMKTIVVGSGGDLPCPILYIGCSSSLWHRIKQLMEIGHVANHPLWAQLDSGWPIDLAVRVTSNFKEAEGRLKNAFRKAHGGELAPMMKT